VLINKKVLCLVFGILTSSAAQVVADDTDIFFGQKTDTGGDDSQSTILFLLDISGSMNGRPSAGGNDSKLDMLKSVMRDFLLTDDEVDNLNNYKIGLSTFSGDGAIINYPILPIDETGLYGAPVREEIVEEVDAIKATGTTPLLGAYYEAMAYMLAKPALFGAPAKQYGHSSSWNGEASHPSTMEGKPPVYNFDGLTAGTCAANSIVMLSDGKATQNAYKKLERSASDTLNALATDPDDGKACVNYGFIQERCGVELADYALNRLDTDNDDSPRIVTHTIGFDIEDDSNAASYLERVANAGGGQFLLAEDKDQLIQSFNNLVQQPVTSTSSFSAPSIPINTSNLLLSNSEIFVNLFATERKPIWNGNIKKFEICRPDSGDCEAGEYVGSDGQVATDENGKLLDEGVGDIWDDGRNPAASDVLSGGLASKVEDWRSRKIYTWTALQYPDEVDQSGSSSDRGWGLYRIDRAREVLEKKSAEPDYTKISDDKGSDGRLRKRLMQSHGHCASGSNVDYECMNRLIKYLLGAKTRDYHTDGSVEGNRWPIADIMHGDVVSIPYGKTSSGESIFKLVFGTNDGGLHMHDARTGEEDFVIYPQEVLDQLPNLEGAKSGSQHIYGLDGSSSFRIRDVDGDFIIEPEDGDFVHFYIGMRRGGYFYYAFNLTPDAALRSHGEDIGNPELLWVIRGTQENDDPLSRLGQTWSKPQYARIVLEEGGEQVSRSVLIFGGGYDAEVEDVDGHYGIKAGASSNLGNAIYIVDADSGEVLWWASSDYSPGSGAAGLEVADMTSSIAADIKLVDSNNDRRVDRLYAADLMGQVWRVDLNKNLEDSSVGMLASLGEAGDANDPDDNENERKFFYEPDFVRIKDENYSGSVPGAESYDLIALVSGNRANPINKSVRNRSYVIRDYLDDEVMLPLGSASPRNFPACNPDGDGNCAESTVIDNDGLLDVTDDVVVRVDNIEIDPTAEALDESNGFFFDLLDDSEIGFSRTQVLAGKLYFTTYSISDKTGSAVAEVSGPDQCRAELGNANLYVVDVISGAPSISTKGEVTVSDRALVLGSQPATAAVPVVTQSGSGVSVLEGRFQTGAQLPPDPGSTELQFYPTFWYQK